MKFVVAFSGAIVLTATTLAPYPRAAVNQVYWVDVGTHMIQRANVDGTGIEAVIWTGSDSPQGLALDVTAGKIYWSQEGADSWIRRANLDGSGQEAIQKNVAHTSAIALDTLHGKLYWIGWTEFGIWRANLDGTGTEKLSGYPVVSSAGLAIDPARGNLYFSAWGWDSGWVGRAKLDGSGVEPLVTDVGAPTGMALDLPRGQMYWVSRRDKTVQRANLDGSNVETVITDLGTPGTIAVDSSMGMIYWTDFGTGKVQRASLDGKSIEDVVTGLALPAAIALPLLSPSCTALTGRGAGKQHQLTWTDVSATAYTVYRATVPGGPYSVVATVPGTQHLFIEAGLAIGMRYYWVVRPLSSTYDEMCQSNEVSYKVAGR